MNRRFLVYALAAAVSAAGSAEPLRVVASTAWTAAFARTAGVDQVSVLAPYQMQHPPEYELKPSDVSLVASADLVIYAGYERSVPRLVEVAGGKPRVLVKIDTDSSLATIRKSVMAIAQAAGTEAQARANLAKIETLYEDWKRELAAAGVLGAPVLVHAMHRPLAVELGFRVQGVFGPAPLEAPQIRELSGQSVRLVMDNAHAPVAAPLKETLRQARFVELLNFPQSSQQDTLAGLLAEDRARVRAALAP